MNISKLILIALHSNAVCQTLLWSYQGKRRESLEKLHNICNRPTAWLVFDYFIDKQDKITCLSKNYPNLLNLICI